MKKIFILAPDLGSGQFFERKFKYHNIISYLHLYTIAPRVIGENENKSSKVTTSFSRAIEKSFSFGLPVVVACNTLQFWLSKVNKKILRRGKIITTFKACKIKFSSKKVKPVWLGTTPTSKLIKSFVSLYKLGLIDLQTNLQELIWRIKIVNGDDFSSAPIQIKRKNTNIFYQKVKIKELKNKIINGLIENNIKSVILGCTELPYAFRYKKLKGIRFYDPADILARYIKTSKI